MGSPAQYQFPITPSLGGASEHIADAVIPELDGLASSVANMAQICGVDHLPLDSIESTANWERVLFR